MSGCHFVGNVAHSYNHAQNPGISCICACHRGGPPIFEIPCCSCRQQHGQFLQQPSITISHTNNEELKLRVELLESRLKDQYKLNDDLIYRINALSAKVNAKLGEIQNKPHECPVCRGNKIISPDENAKCSSCEGKGIIWG